MFSTDIQLRMEDGNHYGYIEANRYGIWGPICSTGWNDSAANTACKQMGFLGGVSMYAYSRSTAPILLGGFNCSDSAQFLKDCTYKGLGEQTGCDYYTSGRSRNFQRAGAMCYNHAGECIFIGFLFVHVLNRYFVISALLFNGLNHFSCKIVFIKRVYAMLTLP